MLFVTEIHKRILCVFRSFVFNKNFKIRNKGCGTLAEKFEDLPLLGERSTIMNFEEGEGIK